jgi:transposase
MCGKRGIFGGRAAARSMLYMLTLTAIRRNEYLKGFYARLVKSGKIKKVAKIACMRKYLIYLNTKIAAVKAAFNLNNLPVRI